MPPTNDSAVITDMEAVFLNHSVKRLIWSMLLSTVHTSCAMAILK